MAVDNTKKSFAKMEFPLTIVDGVAKRYLIQNEAGDLAPMGAEAVSVASDTEVTEMFNEVFGSEA